MPTDKELADALRVALVDAREQREFEFANYLENRIDFLDPPKPTYPDGTIAWASDGNGDKYIVRRYDNEWHSDFDKGGVGIYVAVKDREVTKVEPLRVLGDDEIAIKRANGGEPHSSVVQLLRDQNFEVSAEWMANIVDTYAAEAGDSK